MDDLIVLSLKFVLLPLLLLMLQHQMLVVLGQLLCLPNNLLVVLLAQVNILLCLSLGFLKCLLKLVLSLSDLLL